MLNSKLKMKGAGRDLTGGANLKCKIQNVKLNGNEGDSPVADRCYSWRSHGIDEAMLSMPDESK
jgi:hypothetical protein